MLLLTIWRGMLVLINILVFLGLCDRYRMYHKLWNNEVRDYWYAGCMWSLSGMFFGIEGVARGLPFEFRIVFITVASVFTLKGMLNHSSWGSPPDDSDE